MRLILDIKPGNKLHFQYKRGYIRNFIYSALKNTEFDYVHDAKYKHFNYSNIFPYDSSKDFYLPSRSYKMIFSSHSKKLLRLISHELIKKGLVIGDTVFKVKGMRFLEPLDRIKRVVTATPIIVRIPKHLYDEYNIESNKDHIFWEESEFLGTFFEAVLKNAVRRFNHYINQNNLQLKEIDEGELPKDLFRSFKYKKIIYGWDKYFAGTMWEFSIGEKWQRSNFIKYLYDAGLGERNASSGSGFINVI